MEGKVNQICPFVQCSLLGFCFPNLGSATLRILADSPTLRHASVTVARPVLVYIWGSQSITLSDSAPYVYPTRNETCCCDMSSICLPQNNKSHFGGRPQLRDHSLTIRKPGRLARAATARTARTARAGPWTRTRACRFPCWCYAGPLIEQLRPEALAKWKPNQPNLTHSN